MLRLFWLKAAKKPAAKPPRPLVWSPFGAGSILITSAPSSANIRPAVGPMTVWLNSRTRRPARGVADVPVIARALGRGSGWSGRTGSPAVAGPDVPEASGLRIPCGTGFDVAVRGRPY